MLGSKPDRSWRFISASFHPNTITILDTYPIPMMDDCEDFSGEATWLSTADANSEYQQVFIARQDQNETTFSCQSGPYKFWRVLIGFPRAFATFHLTLNTMVSGFNWGTCLKYFDDLIVSFQSVFDHLNSVDMVHSTLHKTRVSLIFEKCYIFYCWCKVPGTLQ